MMPSKKRGEDQHCRSSPYAHDDWSGPTTAQTTHVDVVVPTGKRNDLDLAQIELGRTVAVLLFGQFQR